MTSVERSILKRFKALVQKRVRLHRMILFGSRARGDAEPESDMDVVVIVDGECDWEVTQYIRHCAWEAGFDECMVITPVIFSLDEWENSPQRSSLLVEAVKTEGLRVCEEM